MPNENSLANLRPWSKGQSGNPSGLDKFGRYRKAIEGEFVAALQVVDEATGRSRARVIIDNLLAAAEDGDRYATRLVLERIVPALQSVQVDLTAGVEVKTTADDEWAALTNGMAGLVEQLAPQNKGTRIDVLEPEELDS